MKPLVTSRAWRAASLMVVLSLLALVLPGAARAQEVVLRDLRYDWGMVGLAIPQMTVRGSRLSEAELRAILEQSSPGDPAERFARLEADTILIPEARMTLTTPVTTDITVYRDITLREIRAGVISALSIARTEGDNTDKELGRTRLTVGETTGEGIDLPHHARVLTGRAGGPDEPMRPLFRRLDYRDYAMSVTDGTMRFTIDRVTSQFTSARPGQTPIADTFRNIIVLADRPKSDTDSSTSDAADLQVIAGLLRLVGDFQAGVVDVEGVRGSGTAEGTQTTFSVARMRFSDVAAAPGFAMSDLRVDGGPIKVELAEFEMRDFHLRDSFKSAADLLERGDLDAFMTDWRRLIPKLGTIRMAGFRFEGPGEQRRGNRPPETLRVSAKSLEFGVLAQTEGIPTAIRFAGEEVAAPLPESSRDANVRAMRAAGLRDVNLSWLADVAWREPSAQLDIRALDISGQNLARIGITGLLNNVTKDAFSTDPALAQVAWLSATAQQLSLSVRDSGGFGLLLANEARKARKTPDALRREWGTAAAVGLPALLGDSEGAKALSGAISRFLARPGALDIAIRSRDPAGIGAADVIASMGQPRALFDKLEVQARAQ